MPACRSAPTRKWWVDRKHEAQPGHGADRLERFCPTRTPVRRRLIAGTLGGSSAPAHDDANVPPHMEPPGHWPWRDLVGALDDLATSGIIYERWSVGNRRASRPEVASS